MISRILNVVNVVRQYLVMERFSPTPTCETCEHVLTIGYNLHDLGRIASYARSCGEISPLDGWAFICDPPLYECTIVPSE